MTCMLEAPYPLKVYPRVGGGTRLIHRLTDEHSWAVYPRVGGGTGLLLARRYAQDIQSGLSPRGRGNLSLNTVRTDWSLRIRSIPAWAGEPRRHISVHQQPALGLSPRGRGNRG